VGDGALWLARRLGLPEGGAVEVAPGFVFSNCPVTVPPPPLPVDFIISAPLAASGKSRTAVTASAAARRRPAASRPLVALLLRGSISCTGASLVLRRSFYRPAGLGD
jgi:hypothetical protein